METREAIWAAIRRLVTFTVRELRLATRCSLEQVRDYVTGLSAAGYLERRDNFAYVLVRDCGIDAPRVRRDGSEITQGKGREQMWLVMKVLDDFSARDLAVHASTEDVHVSEIDAKDYIHYLHQAGYLYEQQRGIPGNRSGGGSLARYWLLPQKYTGPRPPMIQRVKQVYDQNLKKVVWSAAGGDQ
jgi:hypothetical protein